MSRCLLLAVACGVTLSTRMIAAAPPAPERPGYAAVDAIRAAREEPSRLASPQDVQELPVLKAIAGSDGAGQAASSQAALGKPGLESRGEHKPAQNGPVEQVSSNKSTTSVTTAEASHSAHSDCRTGCDSCCEGGCRKHNGFLSWLKSGFDHHRECEHPNACPPLKVLFGGAHIECGMTTGNLIPHFPYYPAFHGYYYFRPYNIQNVREHRAIIHRLGGTRQSPYSTGMFEPVYAANANTDYPEPDSSAAMQQLPRVTPRLPDLESLVK